MKVSVDDAPPTTLAGLALSDATGVNVRVGVAVEVGMATLIAFDVARRVNEPAPNTRSS